MKITSRPSSGRGSVAARQWGPVACLGLVQAEFTGIVSTYAATGSLPVTVFAGVVTGVSTVAIAMALLRQG